MYIGYKESHDKSYSPSIIDITPPRVGWSPDTPDNYCPIINAQYRKDWMERLKPDEEILEFPLNLEEESTSQRQDYERVQTEHNNITDTVSWDKNSSSPPKSARVMNKSKSRDSIGYRDIHGNGTILKAFKNSPWDELLMEYFKNKSALEKKYKNTMNKNHLKS